MASDNKTLGLGLQGGGSHAAFTWGVLDRLLDEVEAPVLVSQTYRLPADLVKELTRVAVSRKLNRTAPWSQQDIVAEAIRDWLAIACKETSEHVILRRLELNNIGLVFDNIGCEHWRTLTDFLP